MESYLALAKNTAKEAGLLLRRRWGRVHRVNYKGVANLVTEMDILAEKYIVAAIRRRFPQHNILAEEKTAPQTVSSYRWVIDPLDGTTNYAHGLPIFSVSIALEKEKELLLGVVYDPLQDHLFWAEKGKGAFLNRKRIRVSSTPRLSQSLLATGFPYDLRSSPINNLDHFAHFVVRTHAVRRLGSAALDLCYVAAGWFDGYWEMKIGPWDLAAGSLIVREAGGKVTNFSGQPIHLDGRYVLATNGKIHRPMMKILKTGRIE
jgi:myo-inositol-1(or 4)-monophosphatase